MCLWILISNSNYTLDGQSLANALKTPKPIEMNNNNIRVMLVEDEALNVRKIKSMLKNIGFELIGVVDNAMDGFKMFEELNPDLLLVDVIIKGKIDGIQFAEEATKMRPVPVIFITSINDYESFSRAKDVGPYGFINKPFDENTLLTAIELALQNFSRDNQREKNEKRNWKPEKRLALVVGCSEYEFAQVLKNPANDARGMEKKLKELSFEVDLLIDPSLRELKMGIDEFGDKLNSFEIGLFFFAGHGVQVKGLNYLIPKDANLKTEKMVEYDCVRASRVLSYMENARTNVNIIILDACRNNPFERSWNRSIQSRGLASMNAPKGSMIAYSTAPGRVASDGFGDFGLYTEELLEDLVVPNTPINQMFQRVRKKVIEKSKGEQIPWESTSLTDDFYFLRK